MPSTASSETRNDHSYSSKKGTLRKRTKVRQPMTTKHENPPDSKTKGPENVPELAQEGSSSPTGSIESYTKLDKEDAGAGSGGDESQQTPKLDVIPPLPPSMSKIDKFLNFYVNYTSSAFQQDKILKIVQWSAWLLARYWPGRLKNKNGDGGVSKGLMSIYGEISWTRYVNRFFGLPAAIQGARTEGSWGPGAIGKALAWSMIGYYPLEHLAYLGWKAPSLAPRKSISASKASAWSCRFWFLYIVVDMLQSHRRLQNLSREEKEASDLDDIQQFAQQRRYHRLQLIRNALFSLPAIHWSLPKWDTDPWLNEDLVNGMMWLESLVSMYQSVN